MSVLASSTIRDLITYCEHQYDLEHGYTNDWTIVGESGEKILVRRKVDPIVAETCDETVMMRSRERDFILYIFHRPSGVSRSMMCMTSKGKVVPCSVDSVIGSLMCV